MAEVNVVSDRSAFEGCVSVLQAGGLPFIEALYRALDIHVQAATEREGIKFACGRGCCLCCRQMVTCTRLEFEAIQRSIKLLPKISRKAIFNNARKKVRDWRKYFERNKFSLQISRTKVYEDWFGRNCPFLFDDHCAIYPVRPIDCRTAVSTQRCTPQSSEGAIRMHFDVEKWANNMILEAEKRRSGTMQTTPLHHWLLVHFFSR